jgi:hypothetical protein
MWIVPPLICLMGLAVALLPPAYPLEDTAPAAPREPVRRWLPVVVTSLALLLIGVALRTVLVT